MAGIWRDIKKGFAGFLALLLVGSYLLLLALALMSIAAVVAGALALWSALTDGFDGFTVIVIALGVAAGFYLRWFFRADLP